MLINSLKPHREVSHDYEDLGDAIRMLETERRDWNDVMSHGNNRESNDVMSHDSYAESGLDASYNEFSRSDGERFNNDRNDRNDAMYSKYNRIEKISHDMQRSIKNKDCCDFFKFYKLHKDRLRYEGEDKSNRTFGNETVGEAFERLLQEQDVLYKCMEKQYNNIVTTEGCKVDSRVKAGITYRVYAEKQQPHLENLKESLNANVIKCVEKTAVEMIREIGLTLQQYVNFVTKTPVLPNSGNYQMRDAVDESKKRTLQLNNKILSKRNGGINSKLV